MIWSCHLYDLIYETIHYLCSFVPICANNIINTAAEKIYFFNNSAFPVTNSPQRPIHRGYRSDRRSDRKKSVAVINTLQRPVHRGFRGGGRKVTDEGNFGKKLSVIIPYSCFQKLRVKRIKIGNISRRPTSIKMPQTTLLTGLMTAHE